MREKIRVIAIVVTALIEALLLLACATHDVWLSTKSPGDMYTVTISREKSRNIFPLSGRVVRFDLFKNGNPLAVDRELTTFNLEDAGFEGRYSSHDWVSESALKFNARSADLRDDQDFLVISNHTTESIKYLVIDALDLFLVIDIQPRSFLEFRVPRYRWQSWISVAGEFSNGKAIQSKGVNFLHRDESSGSLRYCIALENEGLIINSPSVEGWTFDQPIIAKAPECKK